MNKVVWKFPLVIADVSVIEIPSDYRFIHVGLDPSGDPCVWAIVDTESPKKSKPLYIAGTGHKLKTFQHANSHIGSFVQGGFVWHVFQ